MSTATGSTGDHPTEGSHDGGMSGSHKKAAAAADAEGGASNNNNNIGTGDYLRIHWTAPGSVGTGDDSVSSKNATLALKTAIAVARAFDANCALRNPAKECTVPMFEPQELILEGGSSSTGSNNNDNANDYKALRSSGFFTDVALRGIKLTRNLQHGEFSEEEEEFRERFAERSIDGHYAVKVGHVFFGCVFALLFMHSFFLSVSNLIFLWNGAPTYLLAFVFMPFSFVLLQFLQKGIYNSVHAASAASDFMMETKILMNLAPHPNICQIFGVTAAGSDAFLSQGKEGFYIILDRLKDTLVQKMTTWREQQYTDITTRQQKGDDVQDIAKDQYDKLMQRLEMALDIGSALLFLSDRQIVFHIRPDKVGFDARYGRIKLCDFGQARENGQLDQAPSLTKTDDIRTLAYTAPEVLCQAPVTVAADVYAYGVVLWEMLTLHKPFDGLSRSEHFEQVVMNGERPELFPHIPKNVQALMGKCWDPHLRPTMKKVYDTVEEVLLFQDDKSEPMTLPVLFRPANQTTVVVEPKEKAQPRLRRTRTDEGPNQASKAASSQERRPAAPRRAARNHHSSGSADGPMRDRSSKQDHHKYMKDQSSSKQDHHHDASSGGRSSRRNRVKSSSTGHDNNNSKSTEGMKDRSEVMKDRSKASSNNGSSSEVMKDPSMKDESRMKDGSQDSHGPPMRDRSSKKDRVSRKSRTSSIRKSTSEETTPSTKAPAAVVETNGDAPPAPEATSAEDKHNSSLSSLVEENEDQMAAEGSASPLRDKVKAKSTQPIPPVEGAPEESGEANAETTEPEKKKMPGLPPTPTNSSGSKGPAFGRSHTTSSSARRKSSNKQVNPVHREV